MVSLLACNVWQSVSQTEHPLANRTILYQMVALYDYNAQGPEDLEFSEGDTIDILSEGESLGFPNTAQVFSDLIKPCSKTFSLCTTS